jgi:hypothetical protein
MADFLLLGIVPGTRIEITFEIWLLCIELAILSVFIVYVHFGRKTFQYARYYFSVYVSAWRAKRQSLPA